MTKTTLNTTYDPAAIETPLYERWEQAGWFSPQGDSKGYCIMIPPPNVTGSLHMGHAFQDTIMDALIRYHRMRGHRTLWQAGTDHAGIATQMVVERQLAAQGQSRHDLGREAFVNRVWEWKAESGGTITRQLRRMGASLDWSRERFTMDEGLSEAVQEVFVRLYDEGLIYRGKRLVNWDPKLHTAISDLEVRAEEENGHLWHLRYPFSDDADQYVVVATTRPETMLGDAAVAVHPEDERYKDLIGKTVTLPLTERTIPVIGDEYVDPEFGSGCVKITPAHDFNDYEVGQRHGLPQINIFDPNASIELPGSAYDKMDRYAARKQIIRDLEEQDLIDRIEDYKLKVPRGDRSGVVVEPYLTDQWFVKIQPLADEAIKAVEDGRIRFVPENWSRTYFEWMHNIQDWCISRQLWWGHRIPAWYDAEGNIYVGRSEQEVRDQHKLDDALLLTQDEDVLDTWFSSALWPFSTLGWPEKTEALKQFYPTNVLVTGFDIIFFWVARMIMMGLKFMGDVPFHEVYVHGLVLDAHGQKMSKSKGNILDPIDLVDGIELEALVIKRTTGLMQPDMAPKIEKATRQDFPQGIPAFGTDALRFTFAALASQSRNINFDMGRIEGYRNFCNKLWNAARFVLMNSDGEDCGQAGGDYTLSLADRWIVSRLQQVEQQAEKHLAEYRFDLVSQAIYSFVWDEYCSWYVELSKVTLYDGNASTEQLRGTRRTLVRVLETILRLLHPIMPFITDEIWLKVAPLAATRGETIMLQPYPVADNSKVDESAIKEMEWVQAAINAVRNIRGEMNINPKKDLSIFVADTDKEQQRILEENRLSLSSVARISNMEFVEDGTKIDQAASALVANARIMVPLGDLIDKHAETSRLEKERERTSKELDKVKTKLNNPQFVGKAPEAVVEKQKTLLVELETTLNKLDEQLRQVQSL